MNILNWILHMDIKEAMSIFLILTVMSLILCLIITGIKHKDRDNLRLANIIIFGISLILSIALNFGFLLLVTIALFFLVDFIIFKII